MVSSTESPAADARREEVCAATSNRRTFVLVNRDRQCGYQNEIASFALSLAQALKARSAREVQPASVSMPWRNHLDCNLLEAMR